MRSCLPENDSHQGDWQGRHATKHNNTTTNIFQDKGNKGGSNMFWDFVDPYVVVVMFVVVLVDVVVVVKEVVIVVVVVVVVLVIVGYMWYV